MSLNLRGEEEAPVGLAAVGAGGPSQHRVRVEVRERTGPTLVRRHMLQIG